MRSSDEFVSALKSMITDQINRIHTALPGEIVSVNTELGAADVRPKAQIHDKSGAAIEFPVIYSVPVVFPFSSSADASVSFPVKSGDQCLLIFCEQSLEYWLGIGSATDEVKYDISNAICIPGLMKTVSSDFSEAVNSGNVIIRNGDNKITLSKSAITIRGDVTIEGNLSTTGTINGA